MYKTKLSSLRLTALTLASLGSLVLAGCGIGAVDHSVSTQAVKFSGQVHGGESPLVGSTVTFYETNASATGGVAGSVYIPATTNPTLGTTLTDYQGNFSFGTALACSTSTDFVYATASGGNSGSNSVNPQIELLAAVGPCTSFGASTFVVINELTTIAASYALKGFTNVSGSYTTASDTAVPTASYSISSGIATVTAANTLVSGQPVTLVYSTSTFLNGTYTVISATPLQFTFAISNPDVATTAEVGSATPTKVTSIPAVSIASSATNYATSNTAGTSAAGLAHAMTMALQLVDNQGGVRSSLPSNPSAVVPSAVINSLGDILQACVNTNGGIAGSSGGCGTLLTNTTSPLSGAVAPTDTLGAALNIARFPTNHVAALVALIGGTGAAFQPTASPTVDLSLAIAFPKGSLASTNATAGLVYPYFVALDGNDNVYISNGTASTSVSMNQFSIAYDGTPRWSTAPDSTLKLPRSVAPDGLGNLFVTNDGTSSATEDVLVYSASSGTLLQTIATGISGASSVVVDTGNNLWVGFQSTTNLAEYTNTPTGPLPTNYTLDTLGATPTGTATQQIAIDTHGNVWAGAYGTSTTVFSQALPFSAGFGLAEVTATGTGALSAYGMVIDGLGNAWSDGPKALYKTTPTISGGVLTAAAQAAVSATNFPTTGLSSLRFMSVDGNNNIWVEDNNSTSSSAIYYSSTATTPAQYVLKPCIAPVSATACPSNATYGINGPRNVAIDSAGDAWVSSGTNGNVVEIIGGAAPSWPLLSVIKPGLMP